MPKQTWYARTDLTMQGKLFPAGTPIATLETPDGVDFDKALNAIIKNMVTPNQPAPKPEPKAEEQPEHPGTPTRTVLP